MTGRSHSLRRFTKSNPTFFNNFPDEKRERILQVSIDEFADNRYDAISVQPVASRINALNLPGDFDKSSNLSYSFLG